MVTVDQLNVPPRTIGEDAFIDSLARDLHPGRSVKTFRALVLDGTPTSAGRVRVLIDNTATTAKLRSTAKGVRTGDNVEVVKTGGIWHVVGADTWHEPPQVSGSMGTPPPAASTASGNVGKWNGNIPATISAVPDAPTSGVGSTLPWVISWAEDTRAYLLRLDSWLDDLRGKYNSLRSATSNIRGVGNQNADVLSAVQSVVNTNASRLNQTRDYAGNAGQLVEPVVDALKDEGVVR